METIFTVRTEDIERFDKEVEAVKLWQELLWAEAYRINLPLGNVDITEKTKVADGGIDAVVQKPSSVVTESSLFPDESTSYQIKAGSSFQPWQETQIRNELFGKNKPSTQENLGHMVCDCLDKNGTYILVCFGHDLTSDQRKQAVEHLKKFLGEDCGYADPKIDVWSRNNIISFLRPFPALALQINRRPVEFQTHASWCNNDDMRLEFTAGQQQQEAIEGLQQELHQSTSHIRVIGEPGIGKTRLVLEATRDETLSSLVIYIQASTFFGSELMYELMQEENSYQAILIIDECDPLKRSEIVLRFAHLSPRIQLITLYNEHDNVSEILYIEVPSLSDLQVKQIIRQYHHSSEIAQAWVDYCSGSPRVAHVIGHNLKNNPNDMLRTPDSVNIWERYIASGENPYSDAAQRRHLVLRYLALFKHFGYRDRSQTEAKTIQQLIARDDPNITWGQFVRIIQDLRKRKILQGEHTLYITPKLFHIKLWIEWWETYGSTFAIEEILTIESPQLLDKFFEMFEYAVASETAMEIVHELLGPDGPFQQDSSLLETERGARFFRYLGEVAPQTALKTFDDIISNWDRERLQAAKAGRRQIVWLLEQTVQWHPLFTSSARLLLALGEAENEPWSNSATNLFLSQFYLSRTPDFSSNEVPPAIRLPILKEALDSDSHERRILAIAGCGNAMTRRGISTIMRRPVSVGFQPQFWFPKNIDELYTAISEAWHILTHRLDTLPEIEKQAAIDVLIDKVSEVGSEPPLDKMVIDTIQKLIGKQAVDKSELVKAVRKLLHPMNERLKPTSRKLWEDFRDQFLASNEYHDRIRRYVGLDVDRYGDKGRPNLKYQQNLEQLAIESLENRNIFYEELDWLVTVDALYGYEFGLILGKYDVSYSLLQKIVNARRESYDNSSLALLAGYLTNLPYEIREQEMDGWVDDPQTSQWIAELERRWKMSQRSIDRLIQLVYSGKVPVEHLRFWIRREFPEFVTEGIFLDLIEFLAESANGQTIEIILGLYYSYFIEAGHTLSPEPTLRVLTHQTLVIPYTEGISRVSIFNYWYEIAAEFVHLYPSHSLKLSQFILVNLGYTVREKSYFRSHSIFQMILGQHPQAVWNQITSDLDPSDFWIIKRWLRDTSDIDREPMLSLIPPDVVWQWLEEDIDQRIWQVGSFLPPTLESQNREYCWAREFLVRYGHRSDARKSLHANPYPEGWHGPLSLYYVQQSRRLYNWMQKETDANVIQWIQEHISQLEPEIETAKQKERRVSI